MSRQGSPCRDRIPKHTGRFRSRQRLSLSRHRFLAPCRDRNFVLRQGLGLGQGAWVATRVPLCHDRVFLRMGHSCRNIRFYVATGFARVVLRQRVSCRDPQTRLVRTIESWARARQAWARSPAVVLRATGLIARTTPATTLTTRAQLCARQTCLEANSALCCALFEILFMDTVKKKDKKKKKTKRALGFGVSQTLSDMRPISL